MEAAVLTYGRSIQGINSNDCLVIDYNHTNNSDRSTLTSNPTNPSHGQIEANNSHGLESDTLAFKRKSAGLSGWYGRAETDVDNTKIVQKEVPASSTSTPSNKPHIIPVQTIKGRFMTIPKKPPAATNLPARTTTNQVCTTQSQINSDPFPNVLPRPRHTPILTTFQKKKRDQEVKAAESQMNRQPKSSAATSKTATRIFDINNYTSMETPVANSVEGLVIGKGKRHFTDEQLSVMIPLFLKNPNRPWLQRANAASKKLQIESIRITTWFSNQRKSFRDGNHPGWAKTKVNGESQYVVVYRNSDNHMQIKPKSLGTGRVNYAGNLNNSCRNASNDIGKHRQLDHFSGIPEKKFLKNDEIILGVGRNDGENPLIQEQIKTLENEVQLLHCIIRKELSSAERITSVKNEPGVTTPQTQFQPRLGHLLSHQSGISTNLPPVSSNDTSMKDFQINRFYQTQELNASRYRGMREGNGTQYRNKWVSTHRKEYPNDSFSRRRENYQEQNNFRSERSGRPRRRSRSPVPKKNDYSRGSFRNDNRNERKSKYYWSSKNDYSDSSNAEYSKNIKSQNTKNGANYELESMKSRLSSQGKEVGRVETVTSPSGNRTNNSSNFAIKHSLPTIKFKPLTQFQVNPNLPEPNIAATSGNLHLLQMPQDNEANFKTRQAQICTVSLKDIKIYIKEIMPWIKDLKIHFSSCKIEDSSQVIQQIKLLCLLMKKQHAYTCDQLEKIDCRLDKELRNENHYINNTNFKTDVARYWVRVFVYAYHFKIKIDEAVNDFIEQAKVMGIDIKEFPCLETVKKMFIRTSEIQK